MRALLRRESFYPDRLFPTRRETAALQKLISNPAKPNEIRGYRKNPQEPRSMIHSEMRCISSCLIFAANCETRS